jgi:hypothetical protein
VSGDVLCAGEGCEETTRKTNCPMFTKNKVAITPDGALDISGSDFLKLTDKQLAARSKETSKLLSKHLGKKAPVCYDLLGRLIMRSDLMGCCFFGCPGGTQEAHTLQYLSARSSGFARGALKLAMLAFYDESLILVRSLAEIANLLSLFHFEAPSLGEWKAASRRERLGRFSPSAVRRRLENVNGVVMATEDHYRKLCELSAHPVPELHPQAFNEFQKGMTGGIAVQPAGFLVTLNETTGFLACIVFLEALLLKIPKDALRLVRKDCAASLDAAGGVNVSTIGDFFKTKRSTAQP